MLELKPDDQVHVIVVVILLFEKAQFLSQLGSLVGVGLPFLDFRFPVQTLQSLADPHLALDRKKVRLTMAL